MLIQIPNILDKEIVQQINQGLLKSTWNQSSSSDNNFFFVDQASIESKYFSQQILQSIQNNPLFIGASLPNKVFNPLFVKHLEGQAHGVRVDNAIKQDHITGFRVRSDLIGIIFLNDPDQYQGGELILEDNFGSQKIKLLAGDMILYPASCLNYLKTITKGQRITVNIAIESMIRDNHQRSILFDLDNSIRSIFKDNPKHDSVGQLSIIYNNLLRLWMNS